MNASFVRNFILSNVFLYLDRVGCGEMSTKASALVEVVRRLFLCLFRAVCVRHVPVWLRGCVGGVSPVVATAVRSLLFPSTR